MRRTRSRAAIVLVAAVVIAVGLGGCRRLAASRAAGSSWKVEYFQGGEYIVAHTATGQVVAPGVSGTGVWPSLRGVIYFSDIDVVVCEIVNTRNEGAWYIVLQQDAEFGDHRDADLDAVAQRPLLHTNGVTAATIKAEMVSPRAFVLGQGGEIVAGELGDSTAQ